MKSKKQFAEFIAKIASLHFGKGVKVPTCPDCGKPVYVQFVGRGRRVCTPDSERDERSFAE